MIPGEVKYFNVGPLDERKASLGRYFPGVHRVAPIFHGPKRRSAAGLIDWLAARRLAKISMLSNTDIGRRRDRHY